MSASDAKQRKTQGAVGIAGTGRMGTAIAKRLLSHGYPVSVWNRTREKTDALAVEGARVAASPIELAARSDFVFSTLRDAEAIDATYRSASGLLSEDVSETLFVEMSTVPPETERALARDVTIRGGRMIDCPVAGSVGPASRGELIGFAGGEVEHLAEVRPILNLLCERVEHVGPIGSGATVKLAVQLPLHLYWQVLGEALTICEPLDLDPERILEIFVPTPGAPRGLAGRLPSVAAALKGEFSEDVSFDINAVRKDLRLMLAEIERHGAEGVLTRATLASYDHAAANGLGNAIAPALIRESLMTIRRYHH